MSTDTFKRVSPVRTVLRGLGKRCARCGSGKLFTRHFDMVERCPQCDLKFEREEGFFLGAYTMNLAFMIVVAALTIFVGFALLPPDGSIIPMMVVGGLCSLVLPPLLYPNSKTTWVAIDQLMRRGLGEQYSGKDGSSRRS